MANGRRFVLVTGSKQSYACPRLEITGSVSIEHLLEEKIYSRRNKKCQACGVCAAFLLKAEAAVPKVVSIESSRNKVRPHGHDATRKKDILRASAGMVS